MRKLAFSILCLLCAQIVLAQVFTNEEIAEKQFRLKFTEVGYACDALGNRLNSTDSIALPKNSVFRVIYITPQNDLVIQFNQWKDSAQSVRFNKATAIDKATGNKVEAQLYFLLTQDRFSKTAAIFLSPWQVTLGTVIMPFRWRFKPSLFTTNLTLGTAVNVQRRIGRNGSIGGSLGISLSQVFLDSASTKGVEMGVSERPALTPSFNVIFGYKQINLTLGIGVDFINRQKPEDIAWVYRGKPWFGFGLGINLFKANDGEGGAGQATP